jgi:glutaminyl-tRNA synthetase
MRDPVLYRIRHASHHRTGDKWCIYPLYDYTHCISDALEKITHSICTLEFEDHGRSTTGCSTSCAPVLPWHSRQYEFARLNVTYVITSKRPAEAAVDEHHVAGWDDPRDATLVGIRRRGYTPRIDPADVRARSACRRPTSGSTTACLEAALRDDLWSPRRRAWPRCSIR